jgi:hypothetical protein
VLKTDCRLFDRNRKDLKVESLKLKWMFVVIILTLFFVVFVTISDRVQATLGEGTFGKVVKVKDVTKSRYVPLLLLFQSYLRHSWLRLSHFDAFRLKLQAVWLFFCTAAADVLLYSLP